MKMKINHGISERMLDSLERRRTNEHIGPSCAIIEDKDYITKLVRDFEEVDPGSEKALQYAREMLEDIPKKDMKLIIKAAQNGLPDDVKNTGDFNLGNYLGGKRKI
jgi:hypothetical protein